MVILMACTMQVLPMFTRLKTMDFTPHSLPNLQHRIRILGISMDISISQSESFIAISAIHADADGLASARRRISLPTRGQRICNLILPKLRPLINHPMIFLEADVSLSGNLLAVGSDCDDEDGYIDTGSAYLFYIENNGTVTFPDKVTAPNKAPSDRFGSQVSLSRQSSGRRCRTVPIRRASSGGSSGAAYLYGLESNGTLSYLTQMTSLMKRRQTINLEPPFHFQVTPLLWERYGQTSTLLHTSDMCTLDISGYVQGPEVLDNTNFQTAVNLWFSEPMAALLTYGHIQTGTPPG